MEWFVAGAFISAYSSWRGSRASSDAMQAQARIARFQAEIALQNSKFAARRQLKAGREEATFRRRESRRGSGAAVVSAAGAGVELSGSPMARIGKFIADDEMYAAKVVTNAQARASSQLAEGKGRAVGYRASAGALDEQARYTRAAGFLNAIGAGMNIAGGYYVMSRSNRPAPARNSEFTFDWYG